MIYNYKNHGPPSNKNKIIIGAYQVGSGFPDYLYQCGSNHDNGEFAHWVYYLSLLLLFFSPTEQYYTNTFHN